MKFRNKRSFVVVFGHMPAHFEHWFRGGITMARRRTLTESRSAQSQETLSCEKVCVNMDQCSCFESNVWNMLSRSDVIRSITSGAREKGEETSHLCTGWELL
jgi:hypothetical protein